MKTIVSSRSGVPDILACHKGIFIAIEVKGPGNNPTELQKLNIQQIEDSGGSAISVDNFEHFKEWFSAA